MPRFFQVMQNLYAHLPGWAAERVPDANQYRFMLMIVTILPYMVAAWPGPGRARVLFLAGFQLVMLINVFSHIGFTFLAKAATPGLFSALVVNVPFSLVFFGAGLRRGWLRRSDFFCCCLLRSLRMGQGCG